MRWFYNFKIAAKLIIGFLVVALIAGAVGVIGLISINTINEADTLLYEKNTLGLNYAGNANVYYQELRFNALKMMIFDDSDQKNEYIEKIAEYSLKVDEYLKLYEEGIINETDRIQFEDLKPQWAEYKSLIENAVNLAQLGEIEQVENLILGDIASVGDLLQESFDKLFEYNSSSGKERSDQNTQLAKSSMLTMIVVIIAAVLAAVILGFFISRIISKPIGKMVDAADKLAMGDVDVNIKINTRDETGRLAESFSRMIANIREQAIVTEKMAVGDLNIEINAKSDKDVLNIRLNEVLMAVRSLIAEMLTLSKAATDGDLAVRGDIGKFHGDYKKIVAGVNDTLDAVTRPINDAISVMEKVAKGNLQVSVDGDYSGDHAIIKNSINNTITSFNEVIGNINAASEQVASGAKQVSDASTALSQGATEQASSIEELTASLEEISSQTGLNAQNANQANELAETTKINAIEGNEQMKEMLKAMEEINDSSANISKIIKVIDEIAFQTNILALNAAVEAARAGQHGKGFAVVAEEVRNLAARSANAAKETTDLIEGSIKKAENGTKIANDTANALNKIVEDIAKAATLVGDIAVASNEQATGITQINQGIMQVSEVVQTNSATSEESAAASEELSSQAELLRELVSGFKLKKVNKKYGEYEKFDPEILRMLEEMSEKKKSNNSNMEGLEEVIDVSKSGKEQVEKIRNEPASSKHKIILSDKEFGKY